MRKIAFVFALAFVACLAAPLSALAQRDYFTPEEIEIVRDQQQIDKRMEVLVRMIDRRFGAIGIDAGGAKFSPKDAEKWGELPKSTRPEMLYDIKAILQKAIDDIDNLASRPDSMIIEEPENGKKPKGFGELFPKAVHTLAAAAIRFEPVLKNELAKTTVEKEKGSILDTLDMCEQIIAAEKKLKQ